MKLQYRLLTCNALARPRCVFGDINNFNRILSSIVSMNTAPHFHVRTPAYEHDIRSTQTHKCTTIDSAITIQVNSISTANAGATRCAKSKYIVVTLALCQPGSTYLHGQLAIILNSVSQSSLYNRNKLKVIH